MRIKHDGFRNMGRREADRARLFTRHGTDFTARFPKIAAAVASPPVRSCVLDAEAIVVDEKGLAVFDVLRDWLRYHDAVLCTFDLLRLDGADLRQQPLEHRKATRQAMGSGPAFLTMRDLTDEETDDRHYADRRNFYKVEKWSRDGLRVELMLYAGNSLEQGTAFSSARPSIGRGPSQYPPTHAGIGRVAAARDDPLTRFLLDCPAV